VGIIIGRLEKDKDLWLKEMIRRELRVNPEDVEGSTFSRPASAGLAFFLLALLAVAPYAFFLSRESALLSSVTLSIVALFALGSRAFIPRNFKPVAGLESALVGGFAGGLLYFVGVLISKI
jgi:VIT1/CCC1 family predicted Fe2+/Mn2+ transporter